MPLGYYYATCKSYTRISPLHGKENCWRFQGVHRLPHLRLTWIQRLLLTIASIVPPTRTLLLIAITDAPQLGFGGSPLYTVSVALYSTASYPQVSLFRCSDPRSFRHVSAHWFSASSLSSYYSDRLSRNQHRREKASILVP